MKKNINSSFLIRNFVEEALKAILICMHARNILICRPFGPFLLKNSIFQTFYQITKKRKKQRITAFQNRVFE